MADDVEKFLSEQRAMEEKRKALVDQLLKDREAAIKEFNDKLAKIGYTEDGSAARRSHKAKRPAVKPADVAAAKPKDKTP